MDTMTPVPDRKRYRCFKCGIFLTGFGAIIAHETLCQDDRRKPCPRCTQPEHASSVCPPRPSVRVEESCRLRIELVLPNTPPCYHDEVYQWHWNCPTCSTHVVACYDENVTADDIAGDPCCVYCRTKS